MAAITAARNGAKVTLLEKNRQTGKKLLVTGNGRCNFTNRNQELSNYRTDRPDLVKEALESFSVDDTVDFFESLGILYQREKWLSLPGQRTGFFYCRCASADCGERRSQDCLRYESTGSEKNQ